MPASRIDLFHMQDAKNNFNAMRPAPVCRDTTNQLMGHCQNIHISKNCYYGYQETKNSENIYNTDCEMIEAPVVNQTESPPKNGKKRCAEFFVYPESKRLREDDSSMCSRVGTRSSPSHSASAFNINISQFYILFWIFKFTFNIN